MLSHLLIKNYVLIKKLEIEPSEMLNIITGETGAGKSIMLGALGLLMGKRLETKVFHDDEKKCVIEGTFKVDSHGLKGVFKELELDYDSSTIIRREISPSGKSRAFINDTPVNLETLRRIGVRLMDIHSQHDTQMLGSAAFQLRIVDAYAQNGSLLTQFQKDFKTYRKAQEAYEKLLAESAQNNREHDFNVHQFEELEKANLETIKQEELEGELKVLENAEAIQQNLNLCLDVLSTSELSVETGLKSAQTAMSQIAKFGKKFDELKARINSNLIELNDIVLEIEGEESELFFDNDRIVVIQDILNQLYTLQQKHQAESVEDLITLREELQAKMDRVLNFDEEVSKAKQLMESTLEVATETGEKLSATRVEVMPKIEKKLDKLLEGVGIPNGRVTINHATANLTSVGLDDINFLFSANKGMAPAPLKNAASGGEFSRLMLCIKYVLASKISLPTIIFDEIDTGVSGEVAIRVGNMLQDMAKGHQLMAITHLPQIAAKGKKHYFVFKDDSSEKTISLIKELTPDERIYEIAQMIGGHNPTETAYENARELIAMD